MEFSVLWAVFPLLDQLLENRSIRVGVLVAGYTISVFAAVGGILLKRGTRMNGMAVSALIGLSVFIVGMIIAYFTPESGSDQKRKLSK